MNLMLTFNRGKQCFNILLKLITMTYLKNVIKDTQWYFTYILKKKDLRRVLTLKQRMLGRKSANMLTEICAVDSSNWSSSQKTLS